MRANALQFAVVREDPRIELEAMADREVRRVLLIASGGCTALALQAAWPEAEFDLVDPNPAQLQLVRDKVAALEACAGPLDAATARRFNVGVAGRDGLSQGGNFESLFRSLRGFLHEFVAEPGEIEACLLEGAGRAASVSALLAHRYWPVAFELHLGDALLEEMFGPSATQHAAPGSYPGYFRQRLEDGLRAEDAPINPYLHHIFLGAYRPEALPLGLQKPVQKYRFRYLESCLDAAPELEAYDLVGLSNIMDWMSPEECKPMLQRLCAEMRPGTRILWRQLNNRRDRCSWFAPRFVFDPARDRRLAAAERSLFYESVHLGTKEA